MVAAGSSRESKAGARASPILLDKRVDKLGGALRATLKIGEARARDVTHFEACELCMLHKCMLHKGSHPLPVEL